MTIHLFSLRFSSNSLIALNAQPVNSLWLSFFVADPLYEIIVAEQVLRTVFQTLPDLDGLLAAIPSSIPAYPPVSTMFLEIADSFATLDAVKSEKRVNSVEDVRNMAVRKLFAVHECGRGAFIKPLKIRPAKVEDHDDLAPIFNAQSEILTEVYGEFMFAELIQV